MLERATSISGEGSRGLDETPKLANERRGVFVAEASPTSSWSSLKMVDELR